MAKRCDIEPDIIRILAYNWLEDNQERTHTGLILREHVDDFDEYINNMKKDGTWADSLIAFACAKILECYICIVYAEYDINQIKKARNVPIN